MIGTFRKHSQWLWWFIIAGTILTFVKYLAPSSRLGGGGYGGDGPTVDLGSVFGQPLTPQEFRNAAQEAKIFYRVQTRQWPDSASSEKEIKAVAGDFVLLNAELQQNHIQVTPAAAARFTRQFLGVPQDAPIPEDKMNQFLAQFLGDGRECTANDFINYVHLMAGQECLASLFGMSGSLVTSKEAEALYRREYEPMRVEIAYFPGSNYLASVQPQESDIVDFYNKRQAQYRIPDMISVNYVGFETTNYMAAADKELGTNLETKVEEIYRQQDPASLVDENKKPLTPEAAKAKIRLRYRSVQAQIMARRAADEFGTALLAGHDDAHPFTTNDLFTLAKQRGLTVRTTAPFDIRTGPSEFELPATALHTVFSMRDDDPDDKSMSDIYIPSPIPTEAAAYIFGLNSRYPSRIPPLAEIHDKVRADLIQAAALAAARAAGKKLADAAGTAPAGTTFDELCGANGVSPITLEPFSVATPSLTQIPDHTEFQTLQEAVFNLPIGKPSTFFPTDKGGFIALVKERMQVDESEMAQRMPVFLSRIREQRQMSAFENWFGRERQMHLNIPKDAPSAG